MFLNTSTSMAESTSHDTEIILDMYTALIDQIKTINPELTDEIIESSVESTSQVLIANMQFLYKKDIPDNIREQIDSITQLIISALYLVFLEKKIPLDFINQKNTLCIVSSQPSTPITPNTVGKCNGTTKEGTPCKLIPKTPNMWCHHHAPKSDSGAVKSPAYKCGSKTSKGHQCQLIVKTEGALCHHHIAKQ